MNLKNMLIMLLVCGIIILILWVIYPDHAFSNEFWTVFLLGIFIGRTWVNEVRIDIINKRLEEKE